MKETGIERKQRSIDPFVRKLLVGDPTYVDDVRVNKRTAYFGLVRSPHANARIRNMDFVTIRNRRELIDIITGEDLARQGIDPTPVEIPMGGNSLLMRSYLASEKVSYVGEPVAAVLAYDMYSAEDLIEQVTVECDVFDPVCTLEDAKLGTALVHANLKDNVLLSVRMTRNGSDKSSKMDPDESRPNKLHRVKAKFGVKRQAAAPIEPRSVISSYDRATDSYVVYATVQRADLLQVHLSKALEVPLDKVQVKRTGLGGAFGAKGVTPYPEALLSCMFARRNPDLAIKWVSTRSEDLIESVQGRDKYCEIELACDENAKIMELKAKIEADVGVFEVPNGNLSVLNTAKLMPGVYKIPNIDVEVVCYVTHKAPSGPIRDSGRAEACFFIERAVDIMANHFKMDPVEFRTRNLIGPGEFPYDNGLGQLYDSGNYLSILQKVLEAADYEGLKVWRDKINSETKDAAGKDASRVCTRKLAGIGISLAIEDNSVPKSSAAHGEPPENVITFSMGTHLCALVVDAETGVVDIKKYVVADDYGRILDPVFADGRIKGGLGREIGAALFEELVFNDEGQLLNPSFADYLIPSAQTVPNVSSIHCETPSPLTENASKGLGEIGAIGVMAAVFNALNDAVSSVGGMINIAPALPETIQEIIRLSHSL